MDFSSESVVLSSSYFRKAKNTKNSLLKLGNFKLLINNESKKWPVFNKKWKYV